MKIFHLLRSPWSDILASQQRGTLCILLHSWNLSCLSLYTVHLKHIGRHVAIHLNLCTLPESLPHSSTLSTLNAVLHMENVTAVASSDSPLKEWWRPVQQLSWMEPTVTLQVLRDSVTQIKVATMMCLLLYTTTHHSYIVKAHIACFCV